jgi:hypothetical protein
VGDAVTTLIAVLVGAAASLAGSVIVNRMELRRTTRLRLYDELIPLAQRSIAEFRASSFAGEEVTAGR